LPNEQPCLSAAELEAAEILRTAAFKLSQSLLNRNRQQMEMTGGTMMEWKDKGNDGHQILEVGMGEYQFMPWLSFVNSSTRKQPILEGNIPFESPKCPLKSGLTNFKKIPNIL
jgi:hypothetical protein